MSILKRKIDEVDKGEPAPDEKKQLIPRQLPESSITLNFKITTFEEFAPGRLYYLPTCVTPTHLFQSKPIMNQLKKFTGIMEKMQIHTPEVSLKNLIFLQDDLRVQSSTPTDATAFTQVCYLMHFSPPSQTEFFALGNLYNHDTYSYNTLRYSLKPPNKKTSFCLVGDTTYTSFDDTVVLSAKINDAAGYTTNPTVASSKFPEKEPYSIDWPYINPYCMTTKEVDYELASGYSANLNPAAAHFMGADNTIGNALNMSGITIYKYGDTINLPINTNLEGVPLTANQYTNHFWEDDIVVSFKPAEETEVLMGTEFLWPGNNRQMLCRCNNYNPNMLCMNPKTHNKLRHHFITMPPIRKPNGALLGQRCSAICETTISVTLGFGQAVHNPVSSNSDNVDVQNQTHSYMIRRALYGKVYHNAPPKLPITGGILAPCGFTNETYTGYSNDWNGLLAFIAESSDAVKNSAITVSKEKPEKADIYTLEDDMGIINNKSMDLLFPKGQDFTVRLLQKIRQFTNTTFFISRTNRQWQVMCVEDSASESGRKTVYTPINIFGSGLIAATLAAWQVSCPMNVWVTFNWNAINEALSAAGVPIRTCEKGEKKKYRNVNKQIDVFYM